VQGMRVYVHASMCAYMWATDVHMQMCCVHVCVDVGQCRRGVCACGAVGLCRRVRVCVCVCKKSGVPPDAVISGRTGANML